MSPDRPWQRGERVAVERRGQLRLGTVARDESPGEEVTLVLWAPGLWGFVLTEELSDPPPTG